MNHVWTLPWRSSCTSLRSVQSTLLDVPKALFRGRIGGGLPRSAGRVLREYPASTQSLQQQTRCFNSGNSLWATNRTTSITGRSWLRAQYHSSSDFSSKRRLHPKHSKTKPPKGKIPQARRPEDSEDVDPDEGVRLRSEDLSEKEITSIFGPYIDKEEGNRILRILHGQRLSGTLDQGLEVPHASAYAQSLIATGLIWLRAHYPVDEDAAIVARIEREQAEEEKELLEDASRLGILPQQTTDKSKLYGVSGLDAIREHYESQPVAEAKSKVGANGGEPGKLEPIREKRELGMHSLRHYDVL